MCPSFKQFTTRLHLDDTNPFKLLCLVQSLTLVLPDRTVGTIMHTF